MLTHGPSAVVYAVCDTVVDGYIAVVDELQVDVDEIEESVFSPAPHQRLGRGSTSSSARSPRYAARCCRCASRCASSPRATCRGIETEAAPFFRDVLDHLNQAAEVVDTLDTLLSTAFDAHLARISVQQNDDMRKISAGVGLVAVPTLIAGVYGMNFEHMPELGWRSATRSRCC